MRSYRLVMLGLLPLAVAGCQMDPAIMLLEQEHRQLEDMIYQQQDIIEEYRSTVESCRRENAALRQQLGTSFGEPPVTVGPALSPERAEPALPGALAPPKIELPTEPAPSGQIPETLKVPNALPQSHDETLRPRPMPQADPTTPTTLRVVPERGPAGGQDGAAKARSGERPPVEIAVPRALGWDHDADRSSGDEGISVLLQPRDADGRLVFAAAPVSVVVLDPALRGQAARVARWDFAAEEVAGTYRSSSLGEGFHLEMVWPSGPPLHNRLHLFVRYTTDDGRELEADTPIDVDVVGQSGAGWELAEPKPQITDANRTANDVSQHPPNRSTSAPVEPPLTASRLLPSPSLPRAKHARPVWSPYR